MVLSDKTIREYIADGRIRVDPFDERRIQPSSIDLCLSSKVRTFKHSHRHAYVDVKQPTESMTDLIEIDADAPFILHPGEFVLGLTAERVSLPLDVVGRLEGKSSLGRLGLLIHSTAGFVDPGWDGHLTLELANILSVPITLYVAMPIAQISFMRLTTPVENPYGSGRLASKYQGDTGPTPSKYYLNFANPSDHSN
jgi:dCTP deaminase